MKKNIIDSSIHYLNQHGLETFTLELAAKEAGVSKGGLLHHFKTKHLLLEAIADSIFDSFHERMTQLSLAHSPALTKTQAFIMASQEDLLAGAQFNIAITIMEKTHSNLGEKYEQLTRELYQDNLDNQTILMIRLTIDGLYYSRYLNLAPVSARDTKAITTTLFDLTKKETN